ncbi:MAG: glycosyltransferase family 2 protein [Lachnospira sp.]
MHDNIKVSIIMPSLNVAKYIGKCIESVLNQSLIDIEILCVDAGSDDGTMEIIQKYAQKDDRIQIISSEIRSYGYQVNIGMKKAKGKYIGIVETDDYIMPQMYEKLYKVAEENRLDIVKGQAFKFWDDFKDKIKIDNPNLKEYYNTIIKQDNLRLRMKFHMFSWEGIYRREFLYENKILHNESMGAAYQDNGFWLQTMIYAKNVMWIDEPLYMYRQDNTAASMKNTGKMMATMNEYDFVEGKLNSRNHMTENIQGLLNYYRFKELKLAFMRIDDALKREYLKVVKETYNSRKNNVIVNDEIVWYKLEKWLETVTNDEGYLDRYLTKKSEILIKLNNARRLIIYGAGERAKTIIVLLLNLGMLEKLDMLIVTDKSSVDSKDIFGCQIKNVDEFTNQDGDLMIIGVSDKLSDEVISIIRDRNINTELLSSNDMLDLLYVF